MPPSSLSSLGTTRDRSRPAAARGGPARRGAAIVAAVAAIATASPAASAADWSADLSPQLMARFTRQVQPLLINKCAAGACHGGGAAHAPRFDRGDRAGRIDRGITLANIQTLTDLVEKHGGPAALLATVSARHPASAPPAGLVLAPLTTAERATLEAWLRAATGTTDSPAARPAAATATADARPAAPRPNNRFRAMLDAAAHPPNYPPPQEPQGIILGKDGQ
jgi:hypothetical protein